MSGENGRHAARSLRMRPGEKLVLCDGEGMDYTGEISKIDGDSVAIQIITCEESRSEPNLWVNICQGLPKSDKMDSVVQKSVEMGAAQITPILTARCVSRPDKNSARKKSERWQKISQEAAKQSGRGKIPHVCDLTAFFEAIRSAAKDGKVLLFYEGGGKKIAEAVLPGINRYHVFIGPEGGFEEEEVWFAQEQGAEIVTLGPRILRTETAPVAALAALMLLSGNM